MCDVRDNVIVEYRIIKSKTAGEEDHVEILQVDENNERLED